MARTDSNAVKAILQRDYDGKELPNLNPYIDTASLIVDRLEEVAVARGFNLSATRLEVIERWLSAHCYQQSDKGYASRSNLGASGSFQGQTGMGFDSTFYGQTAVKLDYTNTLLDLDQGKRQPYGGWLGKRPSEQIPVRERE